MGDVFHLYLTVNSDQKTEANFIGTLADFASEKLNEQIKNLKKNVKVISIQETFWTSEIRPLQCNSNTWYDRDNLKLSVYMQEE